MAITIHPEMIQGTEEWHAARCGMLTASEMKLIITPTSLKPAANNEASSHLYELLAQRITRYVEPRYISDDMLRGMDDEADARDLYAKHYAPVERAGFITNDRWGFTLGYSPDGLVGDAGLIECKSRRQKFQVETIISGAIPKENMIQAQTGLLVSERSWCDYVTYSGGLPMAVIRVFPDQKVMDAIIAAAAEFEEKIAERFDAFHAAMASGGRFIPTERKEREMFL